MAAEKKEDPTLILSKQKVEEAKRDNSGRVYRVYCDGIFDLFHLGHMRMLEQAKKALGDPAKTYLLVGVCSDELTNKYKGKTVMNHKLRCDSCAHCKWVDEVVPEAPWVIDEAFLEKHQIDFVAHDAIPYVDTSNTATSSGDIYAGIKKAGKFLETQRTDGISTSDLILAIVKDYDEYVKRNLARGYTKEQMNVGSTWEVRYAAHEKIRGVKKAANAAKLEGEGLGHDIVEFMAGFNPHRFDTKTRFSATPYVQHIRKDLPTFGKMFYQHSVGLLKASAMLGMWMCSFANPFSYFGASKKKQQ